MKKRITRNKFTVKEDDFDDWACNPVEDSDKSEELYDDWEDGDLVRTEKRKPKKKIAVILSAVAVAVLIGVLPWAVHAMNKKVRREELPVVTSRPQISAVPSPSVEPIPTPQQVLPSASPPERDTNHDAAAEDCFRYFRSQLSAEDQRLYDAICGELESGTEKLEHINAVNADQIERVFEFVRFDHPEFFWLGDRYTISWNGSGDDREWRIQLHSTLDAERRKIVSERLASAVAYVQKSFGTKSDYEKALGVYEYIIDNTVYDLDYKSNSLSTVVQYGRGVCSGYAAYMQYLLQQLDIPVIYVVGLADGEKHAWNIARLDGEWYQIDVTWGDPKSDPPEEEQKKTFAYFCLTDDEMYLDHIPDRRFSYPICTATACNYFVREGRLIDRYDEEWLISLMQRDQGNAVEFRAASRQLFEDFRQKLAEEGRYQQLMKRAFGKAGDFSWSENEPLQILCFESLSI